MLPHMSQEELEKLNKASNEINQLELELERVRGNFRQVLTGSTHQLKALADTLGSCVDKARPYYDARLQAREVQLETQKAALRFERACGQLVAAKEMVTLAEEAFFNKGGQQFDPAWQEMLNHATMKVSEAEKERLESECAHQNTAASFNDTEMDVKQLYKELKRAVVKSKPYFEMKARFTQTMQEQKSRAATLENAVQLAKQGYAHTLRNLENISDEIHQQRKEARIRRDMGERSAGVGEETPEPPAEAAPQSKETKPDETEKSAPDARSPDLPSDYQQPTAPPERTETLHSTQHPMHVSVVERRHSYERAIEDGPGEDLLGRGHRLRLGFRRKQVSLDSSKPLRHPSFYTDKNIKRSVEKKPIEIKHQSKFDSVKNDTEELGSLENTSECRVDNSQIKQHSNAYNNSEEPCDSDKSQNKAENKSMKTMVQSENKSEAFNRESVPSEMTEGLIASKSKTVFSVLSNILSSKRSAENRDNNKVTVNLVKQTDTAIERSYVVDETVTVESRNVPTDRADVNERNVDGQSTSSADSIEVSWKTKIDQEMTSGKTKLTQTLSTPLRLLNKLIGPSPPEEGLGERYNLRELSESPEPHLPSECMRREGDVTADHVPHRLRSSSHCHTAAHPSLPGPTDADTAGAHASGAAGGTTNSQIESQSTQPCAAATSTTHTHNSHNTQASIAARTYVVTHSKQAQLDATSAPPCHPPSARGLTECGAHVEANDLVIAACKEVTSAVPVREATYASVEDAGGSEEWGSGDGMTAADVAGVNEAVMVDIQRAKAATDGATLGVEQCSDAASMASDAVLDDEQIERAMTDFTDRDVLHSDHAEAHLRTLPARLSYLQEYVTGDALLGDEPQTTDSTA